MSKFIKYTILILSPFFILGLISSHYYSEKNGDLFRIGFFVKNESYLDSIHFEYPDSKYFSSSNIKSTDSIHQFDLLLIGDSFTDQAIYGYKDYLSANDSIRVLYYDGLRDINNPIEKFYALYNSGFFNSIKVRNVILESVEREIVYRGTKINKLIRAQEKNTQIAIQPQLIRKSAFPPPQIVKLPLYNLLYQFDNNAFFSQVYQVPLTQKLFSEERGNNLLFLDSDLTSIQTNNNVGLIKKLNAELNLIHHLLDSRGITLIVLPAPDKFDLYYDYIQNSEEYERPQFFELMKQMKKNYKYIETKHILSSQLDKVRDVYLFNDTHWSPIGASIIAEEIIKTLNN
jgi:hypothetical protein